MEIMRTARKKFFRFLGFCLLSFWLTIDESAAQTFTTLADFDVGGNPRSGLVQATDGNFYGTTSGGGLAGTVYRITQAGTVTILHGFCIPFPCTEGTFPQATLVQATDGNLYGTTLLGGANDSIGTVFKITLAGMLTTLYSFMRGGCCAFGQPNGLVQGTDGNFYGTTQVGGEQGYGAVFKITPGGVLTTLHSFNNMDGRFPIGALLQGPDGNFYGTTSGGGRNGDYGTVFRISPAGMLTTLYSFCPQAGCSDGTSPEANLVRATDGNFYGTTAFGGVSGNCPLGTCGTVFKITPAGVLTTLHRFDGSDGSAPVGGLIQASDGNLYGTTAGCGIIGKCDRGLGTVYKVTAGGTLTTLHSFGKSDGSNPLGGLVQATDGNLYGTTAGGGVHELGTVFTLGLGTAAGPSIQSGGIVPVGSSVSTIQPGEWVSIYGTNLASATATWSGDFPTSLVGTSVSVNGKAAYLSFVSPTQINLQAPDDFTTGLVRVVVKTSSGVTSSTVTLAPFAPSFLLLDSRHVAGIISRLDGTGAYGGGAYDILGPTGSSLGYPTVAAKAGDTVTLFGVGFGPTNPVVAAGHTFAGSAPTTNPVSLLINSLSLTPAFAGLSGAGLYQFNLTIPEGLGTGDMSLRAVVGSIQTPSGVVISLQ